MYLTFRIYGQSMTPAPMAMQYKTVKTYKKIIIFIRKLFTITKEYAIMKLQRGKLFCNNSGKAAPRWEHSRGGAQGGSPEPDVFAIGKKG